MCLPQYQIGTVSAVRSNKTDPYTPCCFHYIQSPSRAAWYPHHRAWPHHFLTIAVWSHTVSHSQILAAFHAPNPVYAPRSALFPESEPLGPVAAIIVALHHLVALNVLFHDSHGLTWFQVLNTENAVRFQAFDLQNLLFFDPSEVVGGQRFETRIGRDAAL